MHRTRAASSKERVAQDRAEEDTFVLESPFSAPIRLDCIAPEGLAGTNLHLRSKNRAIPCRSGLDRVISSLPCRFLGHSFLLLFTAAFVFMSPTYLTQLLSQSYAASRFAKLFEWNTKRDYITNLLTLAYSNRSVGVRGTSLKWNLSSPLSDVLEEKGICFMEQLALVSREVFVKDPRLTPADIHEIDDMLSRFSGTPPKLEATKD
jgi:hypothetical protein